MLRIVFFIALLSSFSLNKLVVPSSNKISTISQAPSGSLGITREQAMIDMGRCVFSAAKLGPQISGIIAWQVWLLVPLAWEIKTMIETCQSFRHLNIDQKCGLTVNSAKDQVFSNWPALINVTNPGEIIRQLNLLKPKLDSIARYCVVPK